MILYICSGFFLKVDCEKISHDFSKMHLNWDVTNSALHITPVCYSRLSVEICVKSILVVLIQWISLGLPKDEIV